MTKYSASKKTKPNSPKHTLDIFFKWTLNILSLIFDWNLLFYNQWMYSSSFQAYRFIEWKASAISPPQMTFPLYEFGIYTNLLLYIFLITMRIPLPLYFNWKSVLLEIILKWEVRSRIRKWFPSLLCFIVNIKTYIYKGSQKFR